MKIPDGSWLLGAALASTAAMIFHADVAIAQTRPALVRDTDEPGRNPYQAFISFNGSVAASSDGRYFCQQPPNPPVCFLILPSVPAGKRLVIENITGTVAVVAPNFPSTVNIQTDVPSFANLVSVPFQLLPGDLGGSTFQYGTNATLRTYVEAGATPRVQVSVSSTPGALRFGLITVSGYLVDLP